MFLRLLLHPTLQVSRAGRTPGVVGLPARGRRVDKEGAGTLLWPVPRLVLGL